jgi:hypothetical protein
MGSPRASTLTLNHAYIKIKSVLKV